MVVVVRAAGVLVVEGAAVLAIIVGVVIVKTTIVVDVAVSTNTALPDMVFLGVFAVCPS